MIELAILLLRLLGYPELAELLERELETDDPMEVGHLAAEDRARLTTALEDLRGVCARSRRRAPPDEWDPIADPEGGD
jgi:hypothetical protein